MLGTVSGDAEFAQGLLRSLHRGHEDRRLRAALRERRHSGEANADRAFAGELTLQDDPAGVRITADVPYGSPAYLGGLERDDVLVTVGGTKVTRAAEVGKLVTSRKPGEPLPVVYERRGMRISTALRLVDDPRITADAG